MKRVRLIGLTGQSGAGKSTAAKVFEQNGFTVINADERVKKVNTYDGTHTSIIGAQKNGKIIALEISKL